MLLFVTRKLWSILDDPGLVVSSVVSSDSAPFSFHMLTGKMGTRPLLMVVMFMVIVTLS
jgi:hypothetical protein